MITKKWYKVCETGNCRVSEFTVASNGHSRGHSSAIKGAIKKIGGPTASAIANAITATQLMQSFRLWIKIEYEHCELVSCWIFWDRRERVTKETDWIEVHPGGATISPIPAHIWLPGDTININVAINRLLNNQCP